jgi:hypothetical protein
MEVSQLGMHFCLYVLDVKLLVVGILLLETHGNLGGNLQVNLMNHQIILWAGYVITWLNSSPLINGYNPFGMNNLSVWTWMFLFGP